MTGIIKHAENANRARAELAEVKAQASELVGTLICLIKSMYVFSDLQGMNFNGRPIEEVVGDLLAAESASEMFKALGDEP